MNALAERTIEVARRYLGVTENLGSNRGTVVQRFQLFIGQWMIGQPWCAAFGTFCVYTAAGELGVEPDFKKSPSSSEIHAWAKQNGRLLTVPETGCIGLVPNGGNAGHNRPYEHTFLVESVEGKQVRTIEGNWRNGVVRNTRTINAKAYAWVRVGMVERPVTVLVAGVMVPTASGYQDESGETWVAVRPVAEAAGWRVDVSGRVATLSRGDKSHMLEMTLRNGRGFATVTKLNGVLGLEKRWDGALREVRLG